MSGSATASRNSTRQSAVPEAARPAAIFGQMTRAPFPRDQDDVCASPTPDDLAMRHKLGHLLRALHSSAHHIVEPFDHPDSQRRPRIPYSSLNRSDKTFMGMTTSPKNPEDVMEMRNIPFGEAFIEEHPIIARNFNDNASLVWDGTMLGAVRRRWAGPRHSAGIVWAIHTLRRTLDWHFSCPNCSTATRPSNRWPKPRSRSADHCGPGGALQADRPHCTGRRRAETVSTQHRVGLVRQGDLQGFHLRVLVVRVQPPTACSRQTGLRRRPCQNCSRSRSGSRNHRQGRADLSDQHQRRKTPAPDRPFRSPAGYADRCAFGPDRSELT
ncbi:conserved hypothetical protein [Ruegeria lacuscaerulensis ITI-1157]|nr:conserved hypothetical protein [Ruegeria lacuscaerulensis ITI-1157]SHJ77172.1 Trimethylamine methyltransferase (MTTB) [Ruegeria lacuscaerulensis ITI-1157]